jgi:hypothetical protein
VSSFQKTSSIVTPEIWLEAVRPGGDIDLGDAEVEAEPLVEGAAAGEIGSIERDVR